MLSARCNLALPSRMLYWWGMPQYLTIILLSLLTGFIVGVLFTALKLPLPAPNALAGVMGIVGIYLGAVVWPHITKLFS